MEHVFIAIFAPLVVFGGLAGLIGTFGWARAESIRARGHVAGQPEATASQDAVLAELKQLKQQIGEMQSTSHQFDISFDAALTRLEQRVSLLETRTPTAVTPAAPEAPQILQNGRRP